MKLVEGNKDGQSNHMRSSQSTRHMAYLKSPVGPMVVGAAGVKSSMLNGGKVPVSIRRAIFYEPHDQTYILCNTANERRGSTISKGELMHQDRKGRARVSGKSVPWTTLMVFRRPALPGPLPITKSPLRGLIGQARMHLKEI